jgi:hypothetical protein
LRKRDKRGRERDTKVEGGGEERERKRERERGQKKGLPRGIPFIFDKN